MDPKLLSTHEAAALLGVGTTSIKRWADEGLLACVKTAGGHRRYEREALLAFRQRQTSQAGAAVAASADSAGRSTSAAPSPSAPASAEARATLDSMDVWIDRLVHGEGSADVVEALERDRATLGSWARVVASCAEVVVEIGRRWEAGSINVLQEHLASARLGRALAIVCESLPLAENAPRALLLTASADDHTLGLQLVELILREAGWAGRWLGRRAPVEQVASFVAEGAAELVCVSASSYSTDGISLAAQAQRLAEACVPRGVPLLLGGQGAWPERPGYGTRVRSLEELTQLLPRLEAR